MKWVEGSGVRLRLRAFVSVFCEMDVNCVVVWGVVGVGGSLLIHASVASLVISFS